MISEEICSLFLQHYQILIHDINAQRSVFKKNHKFKIMVKRHTYLISLVPNLFNDFLLHSSTIMHFLPGEGKENQWTSRMDL